MSDIRVRRVNRKCPQLSTWYGQDMVNAKRPLRKTRRNPSRRLGQLGRIVYDVLDRQKELFVCPLCRGVLDEPVTADCGHTFCQSCLGASSQCFCCSSQIGPNRRINVLIKDLANKWRAHGTKTHDSVMPEVIAKLGLEPRYHLRSRYAGLLPRSNNLQNVTSTFFTSTKESSYTEDNQEFPEKYKSITRSPYRNGYVTHADISSRELSPEEHAERTVNIVCEEVDRIQGETLRSSWNHITKSDLECILCSRCLYDPVTTTCGHTFCRSCLVRVLDHGLACPLCVASLNNSEQSRGTTYSLERAIQLLFPKEYEEEKQANINEIKMLDKDTQVPVFVCTNAFPGVACPLYVYEPRYRLLTRRCLKSHSRKFAMAVRTNKTEKFTSFGTILEVRDAVLLEDGRFILSTVGVRRFKVLNRSEQDGYDTASVEYIRDSEVPPDRLPDLVSLHNRVYDKATRWVKSLTPQALAEVERYIGCMPQVENNWTDLPDGPAWAWWLMPILPLNPQLRVGFLRSTHLEKRLKAMERMLEHLNVRLKAVQRETLNCTEAVDSNESCGFDDVPVNISYTNS